MEHDHTAPGQATVPSRPRRQGSSAGWVRLTTGLAVVLGVMLAPMLAGCGGTSEPASLSGIVRTPTPSAAEVSLPSLTDPGERVDFVADPGGIKVVYFGFTNCPDVCPTTLADFAVALRKLGAERAAEVDLVMVTVDPARDLDVLATYVSSFVDGAVAAGTDDEASLEEAAAPFGASWDVRTLDDGTVEVDHSPFLYALDDRGDLVVTWQFGATSDDMSNDLAILFDRYTA